MNVRYIEREGALFAKTRKRETRLGKVVRTFEHPWEAESAVKFGNHFGWRTIGKKLFAVPLVDMEGGMMKFSGLGQPTKILVVDPKEWPKMDPMPGQDGARSGPIYRRGRN